MERIIQNRTMEIILLFHFNCKILSTDLFNDVVQAIIIIIKLIYFIVEVQRFYVKFLCVFEFALIISGCQFYS